MFQLEKMMLDSFQKEQATKGLEHKLQRIKDSLRSGRGVVTRQQLQEMTQVLEGYIALKKTLKKLETSPIEK